MAEQYRDIKDEIREIRWKFASENIDDDLHTDILFLSTSVGSLKDVAGISYSHSLLVYEGHRGCFYYPDSEAQVINDVLISKLRNNLSWGEIINKNIVIKSIELENIWRPYEGFNSFASFPIEEIIKLYNLQLVKHYELYKYAWIPEILQDPQYGIEQYLISLARRYDPSFTAKSVLSLVPRKSNRTVYYKHDLRVLQIVDTILARNDLRDLFAGPIKYIRTSLPYEINARIRLLINRYGYLGYHGYDERRPYDLNYYLTLIKGYLENPHDLYSFRQRINSYPQSSFLWDKMTSEEKRLLSIYHNWGVTKARRRLSQLKNFYFLDKLIEEIAFRYSVPEDFIRFMTPKEINLMFASGKLPDNVDKRAVSCCCYLRDNDIYIIEGDHKKDIIQIEPKHDKTPVVLQGNIACEGFRVGKAFLINRKADYVSSDLSDCKILIVKEADPDIFCIFDKIEAIVTDQGGVTCHIASLAREYGIPCIVGTQIATSVINQGDLVEVNAFNGTVKIKSPNKKPI